MESTKSRIKPLLETKKEMSEDDMEKFGKKDPEAYPPPKCYFFVCICSQYMHNVLSMALMYLALILVMVQIVEYCTWLMRLEIHCLHSNLAFHICITVHLHEHFPLLIPTEVERFVEVNTQKLAENKYLCPLSGKKFKGPDFVRKHIFNKHSDKVDAVRQEVREKTLEHNLQKLLRIVRNMHKLCINV